MAKGSKAKAGKRQKQHLQQQRAAKERKLIALFFKKN